MAEMSTSSLVAAIPSGPSPYVVTFECAQPEVAASPGKIFPVSLPPASAAGLASLAGSGFHAEGEEQAQDTRRSGKNFRMLLRCTARRFTLTHPAKIGDRRGH